MTTPAGDQILRLGAKKDDVVYARMGAAGPVVLLDAALADEVDKTLKSLEDRRLWSGAIPAVHQVVWGPPGQTWTARKDQDTWKFTGPDQAATQQPAARLEMALWNFQKLESEKTLPRAPPEEPPGLYPGTPGPGRQAPSAPGGGGTQGKDHLVVRTREGESAVTVLVPQASFRQWQEEMHRLTATAGEPDRPRRRVRAARATRSESRLP